MEPYRLHYAPDNAALCVRLGLLALPVPFRTALVDCAMWAQDSAAYRRLHPAGLLAVAQAMDARPATAAAARAEGPGTRPFSAPRLPDPPEWSAT